MKQSRNLVEKISIKDSAPSKSQKNYQVKSVQSKNNSIIENVQSLDELQSINEMERNAQQHQQNRYSLPDKNEPRKNIQQSIIHELKNNLSQISASVSNIKSQYTSLRQSQSQILLNTKTGRNKTKRLSKLDDPEIVSFLSKKQQQQHQREKRRLDQISVIEKKRTQQQEKIQRQKEIAKAEKISQMKKIWYVKEKNITKKQQQAIKQKQVNQIYKKYRDSIPLFQIKQKQDKQKQTKKTEMAKQYLKQRKQIYMSVNQPYQQKYITEHNKKHQQKKQIMQKGFNEQKVEIFQKIQNDNQSLKNLYRGKVTQRIVQEMRAEQQKKSIPYRIKQRIKGYEEFVKQNYKPKPRLSALRKVRSNSSSLHMKEKRDNDSHLSFREIKRYKYLHGVSYGQIVQQRPLAKSFQQGKRMGNGYMELMKLMPKKRTEKSESMILPIKISPKSNPLTHNRSKNAVINIKDQPTRAQINMVLDQLRHNDKKIKDREKIASMKGYHNEENDQDRRQINDQLLLNVEKKINLLHKLQQNKIPLE